MWSVWGRASRGHVRLRLLSVSLGLLICQFAVAPAAQAAGKYSMRAALTGSHLAVTPALVNETLNPGDPPNSNSSITLTNSGAASSSWSITSTLPSWLSVSPTSDTLAPGSSESIFLTFTAPSTTMQTLATTLVISDPNADNSPISLPVTLSVGQYSRTWYFAEGFTGGSFTEYLTLANPNPTTANVAVQYLLQGGQLPLDQTYSILSNARYTINVNQVVGPGQNVAIAITSDQPIIAERPMYFTYTGIAGVSVPGGTDTLGATSLGTQFAFAYLDTTANHDTYLTILNQNSVAIEALVHYYPSGGGTPTNRPHTIPARSRYTIKVNNEGLGQGTFSAVVTLSATSGGAYPAQALGLVERPMYVVDATTDYTGAADVIGVPAGSTNWNFAEGYTSSTFRERYILANPLSITASRATVTFYRTDGSSVSQTVPLQPGQQVVVDANSILGSGVSNSATVTADQPILAERFMSFTYTGVVGAGGSAQIPGATDVLGSQAPSDLFYFAEGYTGGQFAEYLTVENPSASSVNLIVTFLPTNGAQPTTQYYVIGSTSRFTLLTNQVMPGQSFSMVVQASAPVVAERPMYFVYGSGQTGGSDVIGYAPHAPVVYNQGGCGGCVNATNSSVNAGILDETTGLLESTYPVDTGLDWAPLVDPSNAATIYMTQPPATIFGGCNTIVALNGNQSVLWRDSVGCPSGGSSMTAGNGRVYTTNYPANVSSMTALDAWSGATVWTTPIDNGYLQATPTDVGGTLYVTTSSSIYGINDATGAVLWDFTDPTVTAACAGGNYCSYVTTGPANGLLYYAANVYVVSGNVGTFALSVMGAINVSTGARVWYVSSTTNAINALELNGSGSTLYVDSNYNVVAYNATTGAQGWSVANASIAAVGAGQVFVMESAQTGGETLSALNAATGGVNWNYALASNLSFTTPVIVASSYVTTAIYFGASTYNSTNSTWSPTTIYSLNTTTGAQNWSSSTDETELNSSYGQPVGQPMLVVGESGVYFETGLGTAAAFVYGIDEVTGARLWKTELDIPQFPPTGYGPGPMASGISISDPAATPALRLVRLPAPPTHNGAHAPAGSRRT